MHIKGGGVEVVVVLIKGAPTRYQGLRYPPYPYGELLGRSGVHEAEALDLMLPLLVRMREW